MKTLVEPVVGNLAKLPLGILAKVTLRAFQLRLFSENFSQHCVREFLLISFSEELCQPCLQLTVLSGKFS